MEFIEEKGLTGYPKPVFIDGIKVILSQMKNSICKICKTDGFKGSGFFCKIPLTKNDKYIHVFITNNHLINQEYLDDKKDIVIKTIDNEIKVTKKIENDNLSFKYTNKEYNITIIEMNEETKDIYNFWN